MVQQGDGWPLGLQPLNMRNGFIRDLDLNGSVSSNTLLTASAESSSSDLDTKSTGSSFHDPNITLGRLLGVSSVLGLSRRSTRRRSETLRNKKTYKPKPWLFSICSNVSTDAITTENTPSLQNLLEAERRAATSYRRHQSPITYFPADYSHTSLDSNVLFFGGYVDHNHPSLSMSSDDERRSSGGFEHNTNEYRTPLLFSCLRGS